ncbi:MAG TPA: hypothetical protein VJT75_05005 [Thermoleophilaceae bacterium]|nr:hypothetical protein [Thermoleophilaceae bacterium]
MLARFSCRDDSGPVAACAAAVRPGRAIDTRRPGPKTFRVTARDRAGNVATKLVRYAVRP